MKTFLVVTCEHASNSIPAEFIQFFHRNGDVLDSHRAWDIGAADIARMLASEFQVPCFSGEVSRLVVDLNRSETNRSLFSASMRHLSHDERNSVLNDYYRPYRDTILKHVDSLSGRGMVFHVAIHSFTPVLDGVSRQCDIGVLYDPSRIHEKEMASFLKNLLVKKGYAVRRNYPYRGVADGLTVWLRRKFGPDVYSGVELELNQNLLEGLENRVKVASDIAAVVRLALDDRDCH